MLVFEDSLYQVPTMELINSITRMSSLINELYIYNLLSDEKNSIVFYSFDSENIDINNFPCGLIYNVEENENNLNIYIMFIATKYGYRSCGYASDFIKEFMTFIKNKYNNRENIMIILDSIEKSVLFYEHIGFKWITTYEYNKKLHILDDDELEHFVMCYNLY